MLVKTIFRYYVETLAILVNASLHYYQNLYLHFLPVIVKRKQVLVAMLWDVIAVRSKRDQGYSQAVSGLHIRQDWCALEPPPA